MRFQKQQWDIWVSAVRSVKWQEVNISVDASTMAYDKTSLVNNVMKRWFHCFKWLVQKVFGESESGKELCRKDRGDLLSYNVKLKKLALAKQN